MNRALATGVPPSRQRVDCVRFSAALAWPVAPRGQSGDESPHSRRWRADERPVWSLAPIRANFGMLPMNLALAVHWPRAREVRNADCGVRKHRRFMGCEHGRKAKGASHEPRMLW